MNFLLDNLAASLVLGALTLMLLTTQHRERLATVEQNSFFAMRKQQIALVETLEGDFRNARRFYDVGMGVNDATGALEDSTFSFESTLDSLALTATRVEYRLRPRGTRDGRPLYQLYRGETVSGTTTYVPVSLPTLMTWRVVAQNEEEQPVTNVANVANVRQVAIRSAALTPFAVLQRARAPAVEAVRWSITLRPYALRANRL